ncbi:MAG TPA: histidine kinase [Nitrospiraceae bacterium]|nr:histidine kinase [Nitrospiraceae bacterium]
MEQRKKAVLVAVSDIFFYTKIRDALLPKGYVLERARTQDDVRAKAESLHPCAMILNMNDEKLDAFQALEQIKGHERFKAIPVLAFANHEEVDTWKRARELGVTKIVSRNEFSARTRDLLEEVAGTHS